MFFLQMMCGMDYLRFLVLSKGWCQCLDASVQTSGVLEIFDFDLLSESENVEV